jgi:hypothetical protein
MLAAGNLDVWAIENELHISQNTLRCAAPIANLERDY